jgi:hypothetical protein
MNYKGETCQYCMLQLFSRSQMACRANGVPGAKGQAGMRDLSPAEVQGWVSYVRLCAGAQTRVCSRLLALQSADHPACL